MWIGDGTLNAAVANAVVHLVNQYTADLVSTTRRAYQNTMREDLVSEVERIAGRTVDAFLSHNHIDPDIAVETIVLEPLQPRDASRD